MTFTHPVEDIAKRLEKALEAVENPDLIPLMNQDSHNADIGVDETDDSFTVWVDLTGVDPDEIKLSMWDNLLTLATVRPEFDDADEALDDNSEQREDEANPDPDTLENYGDLLYQVSLPGNVDLSQVVAAFIDDRLEVQLPKLKSPTSVSSP